LTNHWPLHTICFHYTIIIIISLLLPLSDNTSPFHNNTTFRSNCHIFINSINGHINTTILTIMTILHHNTHTHTYTHTIQFLASLNSHNNTHNNNNTTINSYHNVNNNNNTILLILLYYVIIIFAIAIISLFLITIIAITLMFIITNSIFYHCHFLLHITHNNITQYYHQYQ